ncbi:MAG: adenylosuccinate synthase [Chloroflexi bacterium]|nr:adenylosuccinate synthase [Chloroflexota bacterium]MDE2652034.1 adenylosuccinate synthase [Chloroflexota bacterium]MXX49481.1 adenylosuccinate synthase [Chloroflexota bacterium]MXX82213.1 adenylosuccinate synthase [Chloroflexota bacterium]MYC55234.1 adenylosuccinate synthase [Chloroflexota bacterium]
MPISIIIGAQWGDEGKGRVVDWLASAADVVARYAGGDNAGHTVALDGEVYKLHLLPSGVLHEQVVSVMGNGMVINPVNLVREIKALRAMGIEISPQNLIISSRAHIITPAHIALDAAKESALGDAKIGTTLRGIGPAYLDKCGRAGIRTGDMLLDVEVFAERLISGIAVANDSLQKQGIEPLDARAAAESYLKAADFLRGFIQDASIFLHQALKAGARVVCEGAQGTLLDIDHGSYPFVTSSSPTAGGALTGLGMGPMQVDRVLGVAKAFSTRVGGGPMPTELEGELADRLRGSGENFWDEFGTTTGRPRRCGWLDGVLLRYACMVNGFSELMLTKLDILSGFEQLKLATAYEIDGLRSEHPPVTNEELERATAIYETMSGWSEDISGCRRFAQLPAAAQNYVQRVAELCEVPINTVSVGPERSQLVQR